MQTFLEETLNYIQANYSTTASTVFVLPSKRAGGFLKNHLRSSANATFFLPKIISIEELVQEISGLTLANGLELLFKSYEVYKATDSFEEKDSFEDYSGWVTTLLNDFNEVDRYLLDTDRFFSYLGSIKTMERWNVTDKKTDFIKSYVAFWSGLPQFYQNLKTYLLKNGVAYQGLIYREAVENIEHYLHAKGHEHHFFIGFNALNTAEQQIIQALLETGNSEIFWDTEKTFIEDKEHSASLFYRKYVKDWKYYSNKSPLFVSDNFSKPKDIEIISCTTDMEQVKTVGQVLENYSEEKLNNTALVLADENLLVPLLHSLPENVRNVNVTMGAALKLFPTTVFFESWLYVHAKGSENYYYKDLIKILGHPFANKILSSKQLLTAITKLNKSHFNIEELLQLTQPNDAEILELFLRPAENKPEEITRRAQELILLAKQFSANAQVEKIVFFEIYSVFEEIRSLTTRFGQITTTKALQQLFIEIVANQTIDFKGEAFEGLQIMGVLEIRALDFENIIVLSVNEGFLPSGKSNASFITYDLKKEFNLPLYNEKDAIYTYHFYHMLHRAKEATLLYTNFSDGLSQGEKSRFLLQLEIEKHPKHSLQHSVVSPKLKIEKAVLKSIDKTDSILERLKEIAGKGLSPSSLTSYIRNPIEFYYQKVLKINEMDEVEETVAHNTLGTIVHDTLEQLYKPYVNGLLTLEILKKMQGNVAAEIASQFNHSFKGGDISKGKNLLIFEVAKRFVHNLIALDIEEISKGNEVVILGVEEKLKLPISLPELDFPIFLGGKVDRVDSYNGAIRIIDYKTGKVQQNELEITDWDQLSIDYKYSKAFQVLCYALMISENSRTAQTEAGVISFKNMSSGFQKFAVKDSPRSRNKNTEITREVLELFSAELKKLILEIFNPDIPFTEKEIE